MSAHEKKK